MTKKFNRHTGFYKIDVFYNKIYQYSTDQCNTCREAKEKYIKNNPAKDRKLVTANFDRE